METREEILKRINWDYSYTVEDQEKILAGNDLQPKIHIYLKLLQSVRWYTLKSILSDDEMKEILSPEVVSRLFPASIKRNYEYARRILYG